MLTPNQSCGLGMCYVDWFGLGHMLLPWSWGGAPHVEGNGEVMSPRVKYRDC